jgi:hypothetical protein
MTDPSTGAIIVSPDKAFVVESESNRRPLRCTRERGVLKIADCKLQDTAAPLRTIGCILQMIPTAKELEAAAITSSC